MSLDPVINDVLAREVPLRTELRPAWAEVLARADRRQSAPPVRPYRRFLASRWALAAALVAAAGLSVGGLAIADSFGPLHRATVDINPSTVGGANGIPTCDLIGKPAGQVATKLARSGVGIEWRFTHWGTAVTTSPGEPVPTTAQEKAAANAQAGAQQVHQEQAVTGGSSDAVSSVPDDSIVWDVVPDGQTNAFVFVQAPNDPNAPTPSCSS
jgi:hypothetical protein